MSCRSGVGTAAQLMNQLYAGPAQINDNAGLQKS